MVQWNFKINFCCLGMSYYNGILIRMWLCFTQRADNNHRDLTLLPINCSLKLNNRQETILFCFSLLLLNLYKYYYN